MNINFNSILKQLMPFVIVIFIAYLLSSILFFILPSKGVEVDKKQNIYLEYKKFNVKQLLGDKVRKQKVNKAVKVVKQEYKLLDSIYLKAVYVMNEEKGWIIIADKSTKTHMLSVGESFKGYELVRVYINYVVFKKANQEYKLELNNDKKVSFSVTKTQNNKPITKKKIPSYEDDETVIVLDDKVSVQRAYLNSYINNFDKIWKDISIREVKDKNGKITGFKVTGFSKHSVFKKLGLKKGDIIKAVNNIELKSYNDAFSVYKKINKIKDLNIRILRNSKAMELNYEIK